MINNIVMLAVLGLILYMAFGDRISYFKNRNASKREKFLAKLADYVESEAKLIPGTDDSYEIRFHHGQDKFIFEDIKEEGYGRDYYIGRLKYQLPFALSLGFTEKSGAVRSSARNISDVVSPWKQNVGKVILPKELVRFECHTNKPQQVNEFLQDEAVVKVLTRFKNVDSRGHPVMSFEVISGMMILKFHPPGELKPNLFDLEHNVPSIEDYLNQLKIIINKVHTLDFEHDQGQDADGPTAP